MKSFRAICISAVTGLFLAACGAVQSPEGSESILAGEPQVYLVDGVTYTPGEMAELAAQNAELYYTVTPEAAAQGRVYVFTTKGEAVKFKQRYTAKVEQGLTAQTSCWTDLDTRTSLYKNTNYGSSALRLVKGSRYDKYDLGSFDQAISSVKGACNVWTDLYDGWYFTGTVWSTFGTNYSGLPSWINNDASSVVVGQ